MNLQFNPILPILLIILTILISSCFPSEEEFVGTQQRGTVVEWDTGLEIV